MNSDQSLYWDMLWPNLAGASPDLVVTLIGMLVALLFIRKYTGPALLVLGASVLMFIGTLGGVIGHTAIAYHGIMTELSHLNLADRHLAMRILTIALDVLAVLMLIIAAFGWRTSKHARNARAVPAGVRSPGALAAGAAGGAVGAVGSMRPGAAPPTTVEKRGMGAGPTEPISKRFYMLSIFGSMILFFLLLIPGIVMFAIAYNAEQSYGQRLVPIADRVAIEQVEPAVPSQSPLSAVEMVSEKFEAPEAVYMTPEGEIMVNAAAAEDLSHSEVIAEIDLLQSAKDKALAKKKEELRAAEEAALRAAIEAAERAEAARIDEEALEEPAEEESAEFGVDEMSYSGTLRSSRSRAPEVLVPAGIGMICFGYLIMLYGAIMVPILLYKLWNSMRDGPIRTTPGKAVGFLFIPFFNFYWVFVAYKGFAVDFNKYIEHHGIEARRMPEGLALALCIFILIGAIPYIGLLFFPVNVVLLFMFFNRAITGANAVRAARARLYGVG